MTTKCCHVFLFVFGLNSMQRVILCYLMQNTLFLVWLPAEQANSGRSAGFVQCCLHRDTVCFDFPTAHELRLVLVFQNARFYWSNDSTVDFTLVSRPKRSHEWWGAFESWRRKPSARWETRWPYWVVTDKLVGWSDALRPQKPQVYWGREPRTATSTFTQLLS